MSLLGTIASCKKGTDAAVDNNKSKMYVRITSVDKDGKT